jgi:hypothetical protein
VVTGLGRVGGVDEDRERVDEKEQKEYLGGRAVGCTTGNGGKMKGVRIGMGK